MTDEALGDIGPAVPIAPLAVQVDRVVKQRDALARLCAEMVTTFRLPANAEKVALLGPTFAEIVAGWAKRFEQASGN